MAYVPLALSLLAGLLSPAHGSNDISRGEVCKNAPFVPGHNLMGEGYDIVTLKRKGAYLVDINTYMTPNGKCKLIKNPLHGNQLQKLPLAAVDFRAITQCQSSIKQTMESSVSKVVSAMTHQDSSDWKVGLKQKDYGDLEVGGTRSDAYNFVSTRAKEDKFTFSIHRSSCRHYRYRVSSTPPLSSEFRKDVSLLPSSYNSFTKAQYRRLISTYGTHYIRQAYLGGRFRRVTAVRTCLSSLNGFSSSKAHSCLSLGINLSLGKYNASGTGNYKSCQNLLQNKDVATSSSTGLHLHHTEVVGGTGWDGKFSLPVDNSQKYKTWLQSLKDHPDIVQYSLRLMSDLVPDLKKRPHVNAAIVDYLKENGISKKDEKPCGVNCCPKRAWSGGKLKRLKRAWSGGKLKRLKRAWSGLLTVTIVRAWGLKGDAIGKTESYVKMWYGPHFRQTRVIKSNNPRWNERYNLGRVDTHADMKIELWDKDRRRDDLLISCMRYPTQGTHRIVCNSRKGWVEVRYRLTCDQHLTGSRCNKYKPTPHK
ncbi:perforin-1-like isoform X1 [Periophthalmus magnuspinnatus]|uniref:perforin-1-like isoform X1 n=1 Tax=Periophthalmus magnuspinnatus TaxID=409849 RepID=UPI00145AFC09|nr:perforin-1-like isoform X1 [Periophthalmus magnuspinnatus]